MEEEIGGGEGIGGGSEAVRAGAEADPGVGPGPHTIIDLCLRFHVNYNLLFDDSNS